mmetsp:Transcript_17405/g.40671  ORF Transcript_17405/g.40671 Transcript_17405/m.40671 type:complete len:127 (-) Transcript_17405:357-737(-)
MSPRPDARGSGQEALEALPLPPPPTLPEQLLLRRCLRGQDGDDFLQRAWVLDMPSWERRVPLPNGTARRGTLPHAYAAASTLRLYFVILAGPPSSFRFLPVAQAEGQGGACCSKGELEYSSSRDVL